MRTRKIFTMLTLVVFMALTATAQYSAKESFGYPKGTTIDTLMGSAGNGWAGSWKKVFVNKKNATVTSDTALAYDNLTYAVPNAGNSLTSLPDTGATELRYSRDLDKVWPNEDGKVYWVSLLMDVKNTTDNSTWAGVKLYNGESGELCMFGKGHGLDKYTCGGGWHGSTGPEVSNVPWTVGPVWMVAKIVMKGTAVGAVNDTVSMWINPDPAGGAPTTVPDAVTSFKMANGFNVVRIEYGGNVGPKGMAVSFDEIRLGTTWSEVSSDLYFATETFSYPKGTTIDTLMGSAGNGWAGSWKKVFVNKKNATVTSDTALAYDNLTYAVPNTGNSLTSLPDTGATELRYSRDLDKVWPNEDGKVYWVSLLMDVKNTTDNSTWAGVKLYNGESGELCMFGKGHGLDKYTCGGGWHGSTGPEVSNVPWTVGPVWMVAKAVMKGTAVGAVNDTVSMWINPDPAGGAPTTVPDAVTSFKMANGFNVVRIEYGGNVGPKGMAVSFDEIRLGTTWGDVSSEYGSITTGVPRQNYGPSQFALHQNYPNPFNPSSLITYELKKTGIVRLAVYDVIGREVAVLVNEVQNTGEHQVTFSGKGLPTGVYLYRLESNGTALTKKMVLLK